MRYLVTGVAGFIGSQVAEHLLPRATELIGVDCFTANYPRAAKEDNLRQLRSKPNFSLLEIDLGAADLAEIVSGVDVVLHQAGLPGVRPSWGRGFSEYVTHNVVATQRLLEAARNAGVRRFVYASSSSVYGNAASYPTSEEALPRPFSPYGVTKLAGEHLCGAYAANYGLSTVSLRYFTVYGPRQRPDMAFHRFVEAGCRGAQIKVYGSGEQVRDFTHVDDVVRANVLATEADLPPGKVLNIAGGSRANVNSVLNLLAGLVPSPLQVARVDHQAGDVEETWARCDEARRLLGWTPTVDLVDGLASQVAWHRTRLEPVLAGRTNGEHEPDRSVVPAPVPRRPANARG
ncbi:NAD-dependent epimerase/dehydratase family protein [Actinopolymorpha singaporensis]|uniref:Nucleoside-diphosphate-sugar epimerase n=1 Tax=Actinopolymorpha singaporensis TaxID=117157 RepID=A0A1H1TSU9_9ACTN|nr:NAD-dependent epimerase/dehydratase family protein [Actinopolymorpha singaporensis]SDS62669.1 Nucleoside-diphosphate-sugar epimerase [Actinopolymorpha singaporensis]